MRFQFSKISLMMHKLVAVLIWWIWAFIERTLCAPSSTIWKQFPIYAILLGHSLEFHYFYSVFSYFNFSWYFFLPIFTHFLICIQVAFSLGPPFNTGRHWGRTTVFLLIATAHNWEKPVITCCMIPYELVMTDTALWSNRFVLSNRKFCHLQLVNRLGLKSKGSPEGFAAIIF